MDYSQFVNPLIGSEGAISGLAYGGGDIFVGAAMPFGMVKLGIDTLETPLNMTTINGGYTPRGRVTGISMLHESGTGGGPKYGYPSQMPLVSVSSPVNILDNNTYMQERIYSEEMARVGYFKTKLQNNVTIELSASRHAGIMSYLYPSDEKHILVDASHFLPSINRAWDAQLYVGGEIEIQPGGLVYTGWTSIAGGWNIGAPVTIYFCGEFDQAPSQARTFSGRNTIPSSRYFRSFQAADASIPEPTFGQEVARSGPLGDRIGALFSWNTTGISRIKSRVGVSFMSIDKACNYKTQEIPSWDLQNIVVSAREEWNRDVFSKIKVAINEGANMTRVALLYSSLYFMHLIPSERVGENPLWESAEPYWDDIYTMWDLFRNQASLYHLIQPRYYESLIRAVIDMWRFEGFLPDGRSGNYNGLVQGGSNADNVLADAYVKGLRGAINWTDGYMAVRTNAEVYPFYDNNPVDSQGTLKEGRGALDDWIPLGYVTADRNTRCISKTVEYALNDFAVSQIASGEMVAEQEKYLNRGAGWQLSWSHDAQSRNFTGFMAPRFANGTFDSNYDLDQCGDCNWADYCYEGTPFEYSFVVPHDMETLIGFMGGQTLFESRLDYIFQANTTSADLGVNGLGITTLMNIANEPDFATPYLYNYINKQHKSVQRSRSLGYEFFFNATNGIPGNSDAGALNCWLLWQMLGLYPIVTTPVYLIESPWFDDINITINHDKNLRITASNLDDANSRKGFYVQSVSINGQIWDKNWFEHEDLGIMTEGGEIHFELGSEPIVWETGPVPPSPGHVVLDGK
ncbi:hypothetical protein EJ05DRAFT_531420 [Pseudovirgaria hyperparasitica]|uniref:Glycoside hydrolase family 92 protein n=1 Tax=Pseudovirgaria hyperparasitica TaxID=470096 RepID=A0A6A6W970_9PEZI|nr:uncharacterized protein EJ05DRAFT_531420 [Pseudovirgaria hyperparasitica]KAF2759095.1 hypothetical protein EJ05DRAFT_531420 [Pseudovirgaria hyperparasitica]